jgi:hypothetical protein
MGSHQVGREREQLVVMSCRRAVLDDDQPDVEPTAQGACVSCPGCLRQRWSVSSGRRWGNTAALRCPPISPPLG